MIIGFIVLVFLVYMFFRNFAVYRYHMRLIKIVFSASVYDYQWRLNVVQSVSYDEMMCKFWKRLDSFYPDKSFLDLNDVRGFSPYAEIDQQRVSATSVRLN